MVHILRRVHEQAPRDVCEISNIATCLLAEFEPPHIDELMEEVEPCQLGYASTHLVRLGPRLVPQRIDLKLSALCLSIPWPLPRLQLGVLCSPLTGLLRSKLGPRCSTVPNTGWPTAQVRSEALDVPQGAQKAQKGPGDNARQQKRILKDSPP